MRLRRLEPSLLPWCQVATFEARRREVARFGHLLGDKLFWVRRGERVRLRVPRSWCLEPGDDVDLGSLVMRGQLEFSWRWD